MKSLAILSLLLLAGTAALCLAEEVKEPAPVTAQETAAPQPAAEPAQPAPVAEPQAAPAAQSAPAAQPAAAPAPGPDIKPLMQTANSNFKKGDYVSADKAVDMALSLNPADFGANKLKGMCQYQLGNLDAAEASFKTAWLVNGKDAELVFYVGALQDKKGNYLAAEKQFSRHKEFGVFNGYASKMKKYLGYVSAKAAKQRAAQALAQEKTLDASQIPPNTVAVVTFANTGSNKELDPLQKGLAEMVATDLSKVERLKIVERSQMQALVNEMALGQTGLLEEKNAERFGKLAGAEKVVNGSFGSDDPATVKMDAGLADVKTGDLKAVESQNGKLEEIFHLEKALVFKIIAEMGIVLTEKEKKKIETIPTHNMLAFLAYSKGLDAEDRGDFAGASAQYSEAAKADPKFSQAKSAAAAANTKADCAKSGDLTKVTATAPAGGSGEITTPVFTVNNLNFSARAAISQYTSQAVMPGFSLTKDARSGVERNSYIDAFNWGFGSGSVIVKTKVPIPDDGL